MLFCVVVVVVVVVAVVDCFFLSRSRSIIARTSSAFLLDVPGSVGSAPAGKKDREIIVSSYL